MENSSDPVSFRPPLRDQRDLLIASVTPQNLERGVLWFKENHLSIKKARAINSWWQNNSIFLERDFVIRPSFLLRQFSEMGYERAHVVCGKGLFAVRGGIIEIWPINSEKPWLIEFAGNTIETMGERVPPLNEVNEVRLHSLRSQRTSIEWLYSGNYVVHRDHGIGIYRGLTRTEKHEEITYYIIEYAPPRNGAEPDRLYVPVEKKNRLTPYIGFETPHIHRLGGMIWFRTKRKAREDAEKFARELFQIYSKRNVALRAPHMGDPTLEEDVRNTFLWQETADQIRAEKEIIADLEKNEPMDRLLCGDVGFGKTELALRAAARVIASGKQVALLSPTTILAAQHEKTFRERMSNRLPITVSMLSRLTHRQEERKILQDISNGRTDCVIGTHRLLGKDVQFKNLGLIIIDEEQRFGVKQKEYFKSLRTELDILSLSATPIPRTLSMALANLRGISLLETPPPERKPIQTFVLPYSLKTIRNAIAKEIVRGGQVYFLHNRIETMEQTREKIKKIMRLHDIPIGIIHGRMKEKELIGTMDAFRNRKIHILLATTIIENGLDIASANTLIVDDATRLGLAEAHQLRGRIGRGDAQAFAYFFYHPRRLTETAAERLDALDTFSHLGAGYSIALRDCDIRGAGNVLGKEQSGTINKVGLNLYCQMLAEATEKLKSAT